MEQSAEEIQDDISQTRSGLEETVKAIAYKADIKARANDVLHEKTDAIKEAVGGAVSGFSAGSGDTKMANAKSTTGLNIGAIQGNPLGVALGSVAIGFLIGSLLPGTQIEREQIGELGENLTQSAKNKANELVDQGKEAISQSVKQVINSSSRSKASNFSANESSAESIESAL